MKKTIILFFFVIAGWQSAFAQTFSVNGISYNVTSSTTVEVGMQNGKATGAITIPEQVSSSSKTYTVTSIGSQAFRVSYGLTAVTLPSTIKTFSEAAFADCTGLKSINIPNSVTTIGQSALYNCSSLTAITIPNSVTKIEGGAFQNCTELTSITIPNSVTSLGGAFLNCYKLSSVTLPNSITRIEGNTFGNNFALRSITIPNTVTSIGSNAFAGCILLSSFTIPNAVTSIEGAAFSMCYALTSITIPSAVTNLGESAFKSCTGLTSITIPNSITSVKDNTFEFCTGLKSVTISNSATSIGLNAFRNCEALASVTLPNTLTTIGEGSFAGCKSLTNLTIPNSVTSIGTATFYGCGFKSISIPSSVTYLGNGAFQMCTALTGIEIPNSVISINPYLFYGCTGLTTISIPSSVTSIGSNAFRDCSNLTAVIVNRVQPVSIDNWVFSGVNQAACSLLIPTSALSAYQSAAYWKNFKIITTVPTTKIKDTQCGVTLAAFNTTIAADLVTAAQMYGFEVSDGSTVRTFESTTNSCDMTKFVGISYGTTYAVRVKVKMGVWGDYGTACNLTTPAFKQGDCFYSNTTEAVSTCSAYKWAVDGKTYATSGTYSSVTACVTKNLELTITGQPAAPTGLSCFEVATWNPVICDYEIFANLPAAPKVNCYEATTWNDDTCSWVISGTKPEPVLSCNETATWNATTCQYDVTTIPAPSIACYETAVWNSVTCKYDITGTKPDQPTLTCYETVAWNAATCEWDITVAFPAAPIVKCYETVTWNEAKCGYDVTGAMPETPEVNCYETATWNATSCQYDITGAFPAEPTVLCYQTATWNSSTCQYDISGVKPAAPIVACYETASWNSDTCEYDITGAQAAEPALLCYQTATWNSASCSYDITGTKPDQPTLACYEKATWNADSCEYDITGAQPAAPTLLCYQTADFNTTSCKWVVSGSQPRITSISGAGAICNGASKTLALATGTVGTLQWQSSTTSATASDFTNSSDTTDLASLTVTPAVSTWYRALASVGTCPPATSAAVAVTVGQPTAVGTISALSSSICTSTGTTLTLSAATGTIAWQKATVINGVTGAFTTVSGNATTTLVTGNLSSTTAYRVVVSSGVCSTSISESITITVSRSSVARTISGAGVICNGTSKTLYLAAGSVGTTQWQSSTTSATASDFTNSSDTTNLASLTVTPAVTTWYRVVATSGACSPATSAAIAVTVSQPTAVGTLSALRSSICTGTGTTLTLSDATGAIAWQKATVTKGVTGTFTTVTGNTNTTLVTANLSASTAYRVIVSSGACATSTSEPITIIVSPASLAKTISGAGVICNGASKTLTLAAGSVGTIQWQSSTTSATASDFTNSSDATNLASLTVTPAVTTWYRVVATSGNCSPATSAAVAVTFYQTAAVGTISALSSSICTGTGTTLTLSSAAGTIAWQRAIITNGVIGVFKTVTGNTSTLATGNLSVSVAYRAIVSSGACTTATSEPITIAVIPAAKLAAITGYNTVTTAVCIGSTKTLTLAAGYVGTIEWLIANYPTGTYTVIPGATATTYNYIPTSAAVKYFKVRLTSSPCSATITSTTIVAVYAKDCATTSAKIATPVQADSASSAVVDTNLHSDNLSSSVTPSKQTNIEVPVAITAQIEQAAIETSLKFDVVAYPNPYNANFTLNLTSSKTATITVAVYDMTGRQIENRMVNSTEINNLALGDNYPSGVYNVLVSQGAEITTLRLIKK